MRGAAEHIERHDELFAGVMRYNDSFAASDYYILARRLHRRVEYPIAKSIRPYHLKMMRF